MSDLEQMVKDVRALGAIETDELALRWLRAATGTLATWGGVAAREALEEALPKELLSGGGSKGRSLKGANPPAGTSDGTALLSEIGRRAGQEDPGKISQMAQAAMARIKQDLSPAQLDQLLAALPEDAAAEVRRSSTTPPWRYFLVPQSHDRPPRSRH